MGDTKQAVKEYLIEKGYEDRLDKPYMCCTHRSGLPHYVAAVRPFFSPVDGDHIIIISPTEVMSAVCFIPLNHHNWTIQNRSGYSTPEGMIEAIEKFSDAPTGCW